MGARSAPPGFREDVHRQALLLRGAPEEVEAIAFIEAVADTGDSEATSSRSGARAHCPPV
nr:antitoxin MazE-like protein [uncultured Rhodopila sp.]